MGRVCTMAQQRFDHVTVTVFDGSDERGHTVLVFLFDVERGRLGEDLVNLVELTIERGLKEVRDHDLRRNERDLSE
jgi:hypothetical protein